MLHRPSSALENAVASGVRVAHIEPLQRRIERNRVRFVGFMLAFTTAVALALFCALAVAAVAVGAIVAGASEGAIALGTGLLAPGTLLPVAAGIALALAWAWSLTRLARSELWLIRRLGAQMPKGGTLLETKSVLRDMAIAAGLPDTPQFYVIDTPRVNAFVLGRSPKRVRVGVTRGLLERIPIDEQRAVFANLIARVLSRDTLWATAVSALMGPIWAMREYDLRFDPVKRDANAESEQAQTEDWRAGSLLVYAVAVVVTEFLSWYHQEAAWKAAEKADAEGMMLLKDPRAMLRAIEHVLDRDNHVPSAGDAYSQLFFCWAGFGFAPEDDPEMRRVARLRETLGAEGAAYVPRPNVPGWPSAPVAPRVELVEPTGAAEGADDAR